MLKLIKVILKTLFKDERKCNSCEYLMSISNRSPCYECKNGDKYERSSFII